MGSKRKCHTAKLRLYLDIFLPCCWHFPLFRCILLIRCPLVRHFTVFDFTARQCNFIYSEKVMPSTRHTSMDLLTPLSSVAYRYSHQLSSFTVDQSTKHRPNLWNSPVLAGQAGQQGSKPPYEQYLLTILCKILKFILFFILK